VLLGRTAFQCKDYFRSANAYRQGINLNWRSSNDAKVWYDYAISLFRIGNFHEADQAFSTVLKQDSGFYAKSHVIVFQAIIRKLNLNYRGAIDLFLKAINDECYSQVQTVQILCNIGLCLENINQTKNTPQHSLALEAYKKASELDDQSFEALKCQACYHFSKRDYKSTLELLVKLDNNQLEQDFDCLFMTAKSLEASGQTKDAFTYLNKATKLNPQHAVAFCYVGISFYKFKLYRDAFTSFHRSYMLDPTLIESLYNMGLLYELSKRYSEALSIYIRIIAINPNDSQSLARKRDLDGQNFHTI
jgi:tetratricopeptide (TPR) repeat protein